MGCLGTVGQNNAVRHIRFLLFRSIFFFLILRIDKGVGQDELSNEVVGEPFVSCAADAIYIKLRTNRTFEGHVDVKFVPNKYCYQVLITNNQIEVLIPHEECSVQRRRSLHPSGVILETSLSISFHPEFTTIDDRIFKFKCFHVKKLKTSLEPGSATELPKDELSGPSCSYSILRSLGGVPVGTVSLGQTVFHQWSCENTKNSCLIVRNCVLVAGEARHLLIGADGCSKDIRILPDLTYLNQSFVGQNVSVFGVSQSSLVYFECDLLLLPYLEEHHQCQLPHCVREMNRSRRSFDDSSDLVMEVQSQRIEISELGHLSLTGSPSKLYESMELSCQEKSSQEGELCITVSTFALVLAASTFTGISALLIATVSLIQRYRYYNVSQSA